MTVSIHSNTARGFEKNEGDVKSAKMEEFYGKTLLREVGVPQKRAKIEELYELKCELRALEIKISNLEREIMLESLVERPEKFVFSEFLRVNTK